MATLFFSYSHKDEALRDQLEAHLALLKSQGLIGPWHDRRIVAGDVVDDAIAAQLESADIILLLVSSDFISSPYCYSREMMRALERHDAGQARVIPVILRHCEWHSAPFGKLLAVPKDGKPITSWPDRDEAFADVARQVRRVVEANTAPLDVTAEPRHRPQSNPVGPSIEAAGTTRLPRSSNLRVRKEFSDKDRDDFLRSTFEFVCNFFDGSLEAVGERNVDVTGSFDRVDSRRMAAKLYRNGKTLAECSVRLEGMGGRDNGIAFSYDASVARGSFNEMLSVQVNDQTMYLSAMGMAWNGDGASKHLSQEGAAELLWELFISKAQV